MAWPVGVVMGRHLTVYGGGTLQSNTRSYHSLDLWGSDSPEDQAQLALEGENKVLNPWHLIYESAPGAIVQPGTLEIVLEDPWDIEDDEQLGVLWDNSKVVAKKAVREGTTVYIPIPSIEGDRLSIWLTDENPANVRYITDAQEAREEEAKAADKHKSDLSDKLASVGEGVKESTSNLKWTIGGLAIIALAGAAVYFSLKK